MSDENLSREAEEFLSDAPIEAPESFPFHGGGRLGLGEEVVRSIETMAVEKAGKKLEFAGKCAVTISLFGIAVMILVAWLAMRHKVQPTKLISLVLIVTAALLLLVLGYTDEQMSPVIGLLGTIAGYMLGSKEWTTDPPDDSSPAPAAPTTPSPAAGSPASPAPGSAPPPPGSSV